MRVIALNQLRNTGLALVDFQESLKDSWNTTFDRARAWLGGLLGWDIWTRLV